MRVVVWNCCMGFTEDLLRLHSLAPEIAIVSEVPVLPPEATLLDPALDWHWAGRSRGIAIAVFGDKAQRVDPVGDPGRYSVSVEHPAGVGVLGIWGCPEKGKRYAPEVVAAIESRAEWLTRVPCLIGGDFNLAPKGAEDERDGSLRRIFGRLDGLGYTSLYHHSTGEVYGAERQATHYFRRHEHAPFHIDFVFVHRDLVPKVTGFQVGTHADWVAASDRAPGASDHVPLTVDLTI